MNHAPDRRARRPGWRKRRPRPVFTSRFRLAARRLLHGRASLYEDRLELKGWGLGGRFRLSIPVDRLARIEWWNGAAGENLEMILSDGAVLRVWIEGAGRWKIALDRQLQARETARPAPGASGARRAAAA